MSMSDFLDMSRWTETKGMTSMAGPICPHCEGQLGILDLRGSPPPHPSMLSAAQCTRCGKIFWWCRMETPLGLAWQTWQADPRRPMQALKPRSL